MTTDGSTGRRDGFNRWVASMKTDHEPMQAKPAALKPVVPKLELELDDNATHVHRIPKELIHRMREQQQETPASAPVAEPEDDDDDELTRSPLGMVQEDRTAIFRPPPELLARAKRMKKPDAQASVPTKPPPASQAELVQSMPASPKVPGFESVTAAAKGGFAAMPVKAPLTSGAPARAAARASAAAQPSEAAVARVATPAHRSASVAASAAVAASPPAAAASLLDFAEPVAEPVAAAPPASGPAPDSSAVFARREVGSGVLPAPSALPLASHFDDNDNDEPDTREYRLPELGLPERAPAVATPEPAAELAESPAALPEAESPFAFEPSSVVPLVPPLVDVAGSDPVAPAVEVEEPGAPTTHAPVVRAEASAAPEPSAPLVSRALLFVFVALAAAAVAWWQSHH